MPKEPVEERVEEHDVLFHAPLPPPFPPPPGARRVIFFRDEGLEEGREHEDIMLRRVPRAVAMQFRAAAGGRGLTHAQYLSALVALHETARALADAGDERTAAQLEQLGLQTVTV